MKKTTIKGSSSIDTIGYDEQKKEMEVSFHNSGDYHYLDVSKEEYDNIMLTYSNGGSVGSVLIKTVKGKTCVNMRKESMDEN